MNNFFLKLIVCLGIASLVACGKKETPPPPKPVAKTELVKPANPEKPPAPVAVEPKREEPAVEPVVPVKPDVPVPVVEPEPVKLMAEQKPVVVTPPKKPVAQAIKQVLGGAKRIAFVGDQMTDPGRFIEDFECVLVANKVEAEVLNLGLAGELVADPEMSSDEPPVALPPPAGHTFALPRLSELFQRIKPDLLFLCYGMDDAGYLGADGAGFGRFASGYSKVREAALASGIKRVICLTPPPYELGSGQPDPQVWRRDIVFTITTWLGERGRDGWRVVELTSALDQVLDAGRRIDPNFSLTTDGVTLSRAGQWAVAQQLLRIEMGVEIQDAATVDSVMGTNAKEIRKLVAERAALRRDLWVPGPDAMAAAEARDRIAKIGAELKKLAN